MVDTILDETFVRESLPSQACCQSCRAPLELPPASPLATSSAHSQTDVTSPPPPPPSPPQGSPSPLPPDFDCSHTSHPAPSTSRESEVSAPSTPTLSTPPPTPTLSTPLTTTSSTGEINPAPVTRLYKCTTCGEFLECRSCCLKRHAFTPLHMLKVSLEHPVSLM